jgi:hypothetical protein
MKFTKEELGFIKLYAKVSDTTSEYSDLIALKPLEKDLLFYQFTKNIKMFTILKDKVDGYVNNIFNSGDINQLLQKSKKKVDITLNGSKLSFGTSSQYTLYNHDLDVSSLPVDNYIEQINTLESKEVYNIPSFINFKGFDFYKLQDDDLLNTICHHDGHWIISDKDNALILKSGFSYDKPFFINGDITKVVSDVLLEEDGSLNVYMLEDIEHLLIKTRDTYIFVPIGFLPPTPDFRQYAKEIYYNPNIMIKVDSECVKESLSRISTAASKKYGYGRIFIKFEDRRIKLESKDIFLLDTSSFAKLDSIKAHGIEYIDAQVPNDIIGYDFSVDSSNLNKIIANHPSANIYISFFQDKDKKQFGISICPEFENYIVVVRKLLLGD